MIGCERSTPRARPELFALVRKALLEIREPLTSQPVNRPLLKLFQRDVGSRSITIEVEARGIIGFLVLRRSKLLLPMVDDISPLWVNAIVLLPQHDGQAIMSESGGCCSCCVVSSGMTVGSHQTIDKVMGTRMRRTRRTRLVVWGSSRDSVLLWCFDCVHTVLLLPTLHLFS